MVPPMIWSKISKYNNVSPQKCTTKILEMSLDTPPEFPMVSSGNTDKANCV